MSYESKDPINNNKVEKNNNETPSFEVQPTLEGKVGWQLKVGSVAMDDPLLGCLVMLTKMENRPFSSETLTVGLPLINNKLTPELFIRAAKRAGLSSQIVKRPLQEISSLVLPVVLLLKNQQACILTAYKSDNIAQIIQPETSEGTQKVRMEQLASKYTGYAIFIRPTYRFDARSKISAVTKDTEHWFLEVMKRIWPFYIEIMIASFMINIFAILSPLFVMNVYDRVIPNNAMETLIVLATGIATVYCFDFIMKMLRGYFIDVAGKKADILLGATIFEHMLGMKMETRPESVGSFANNISQFDSFRDFITSATMSAVIDLPFTLIFLGVLYIVGGPMAYVSMVSMPIIVITGFIIQRPLNKIIKDSYRYTAQKQAMLIESLVGIENIKTVGAEGILQNKWEHIGGMASKLLISSKILSNLAINISSFVIQISGIMLIIVGVGLIMQNKVTMGALIACNMLNGRILQPLAQIASLITRYHQAMTAFKSVDNMMHLPVERAPGKKPLHHSDFLGNMEFKNVSFKYPKQQTCYLEKMSFNISVREKVGIIGKIGSGKTTISRLLLGLYEPSEGSVLFDGIEAKQLDPVVIRRNIGYVPQDILLFYGTVKDNIVLGAPYVDDSAIIQAANIAGIGEFISKHPKGFDLDVGERGVLLSGGQRQEIAIARALLLDPKILVFDEPTNMMDNNTEEAFKMKLQTTLQDKTFILITHKASLLNLVDRIIVIDEGKILADGPKEMVFKALTEGKMRKPNA